MDLVPEKFTDMPYAPFSKSDRLGRAADWGSYGNRHGRDGATDENGSEFTIVDNKMVPRATGFRGRGRGGFRGGGFRGGRGRLGDRFADRRDARDSRNRNSRGGATRGGKGYGRRWDDRRNNQRESSVDVGTSWHVLEEIATSVLAKLDFQNKVEDEELIKCGSLPYYDRTMDRVSVRAPRTLAAPPGGTVYPKVTTTDDPVIRRLAGANAGNVFATASILATIMVAPRSIHSWDIVVQRIGGKLFFDKRDGSVADRITVNETSHESPKDEKALPAEEAMNSSQHLSVEATAINSKFAQMSVNKNNAYKYPEPNPFEEDAEEPLAPAGYKYKKWVISEKISVVARCDIDACTPPSKEGEEPKLMMIKALNEYYDPHARVPTEWRNKLDTQRGAVVATEVYNNACKLARWTVEAILADANTMKFGFVSRTRNNNNSEHEILGTQMYRPKEFAVQITLKTTNMWGILKHIIELCYKHLNDGEKCVLLKDPNRPTLRIYKVPNNAFESDDEEESEEEEEGPSFAG